MENQYPYRNIVLMSVGIALVVLGVLIFYLSGRFPGEQFRPEAVITSPLSGSERAGLLGKMAADARPMLGVDAREERLTDLSDAAKPKLSDAARAAALQKMK